MKADGTDGITETDGTVENANSAVSTQEGGQSSIAVAETAKQLETLQKQVELLTRQLQSSKDKAVAKTNQRIDNLEKDLKSVLQDALKNGQSVQDVLGSIEAEEERETKETLRELARAYKEGRSPTSTSRGSDDADGVDVTKVLRELELDETDTRVLAFKAQSFSSEAEAYRQGALLFKQITSKQPSAADMPTGVARTQGQPSNQEKLMQEYERRKENLRGQALINLKMEMRKKGLRSIG